MVLSEASWSDFQDLLAYLTVARMYDLDEDEDDGGSEQMLSWRICSARLSLPTVATEHGGILPSARFRSPPGFFPLPPRPRRNSWSS